MFDNPIRELVFIIKLTTVVSDIQDLYVHVPGEIPDDDYFSWQDAEDFAAVLKISNLEFHNVSMKHNTVILFDEKNLKYYPMDIEYFVNYIQSHVVVYGIIKGTFRIYKRGHSLRIKRIMEK